MRRAILNNIEVTVPDHCSEVTVWNGMLVGRKHPGEQWLPLNMYKSEIVHSGGPQKTEEFYEPKPGDTVIVLHVPHNPCIYIGWSPDRQLHVVEYTPDDGSGPQLWYTDSVSPAKVEGETK